jgi:hypothetical protein
MLKACTLKDELVYYGILAYLVKYHCVVHACDFDYEPSWSVMRTCLN